MRLVNHPDWHIFSSLACEQSQSIFVRFDAHFEQKF